MALPPVSLAILDTETTGFLPRSHRVIELAIVRIEDGKTACAYDGLFSIDNEDIPPHVQVLTRIRPEDLQGKPRIGDEAAAITKALEGVDVLIGQNISFDTAMLKGEGIDLTDRPCMDTAMLAALVFPELPSFSLQYISRALQLTHEPAHRAMGDVRATCGLLERCWERFLELPEPQRAVARAVMGRGPEGNRRLFSLLPQGKSGRLPAWFTERSHARREPACPAVNLLSADVGTVVLQEEHATCPLLKSLLLAAPSDVQTWVSVKNIETAGRRLHLPTHARVLLPPYLLVDPSATERFLAQERFSADEVTLALKLQWFGPQTRLDVTLHGGERAVWNGKIACTESTEKYRAQFMDVTGIVLLDHRQLLSFFEDDGHAAHTAIAPGSHLIIDDASMLEDTATKAYGHACPIADLRAAAEGHPGLTRFTDLLELWTEATRHMKDIHYITKSELDGREAKGLREQLGLLLVEEGIPERTCHYLRHVAAILDPSLLSGSITWIETMKNGAKTLHAVPERVDAALDRHLYERFPVTLITPASMDVLPEIVPSSTKTTVRNAPVCGSALSVRYGTEKVEDFLKNPPEGKTIVLATSKRMIEDWFVQYAEALEERGVELVCQGLSGGQGRMEEAFIASEGPTLWILTPWLYEGVELPTGGVDRLVIDTLPFDHPSHPVLSIRARHYRDAFDAYTMPRLCARIFRILRTFARHRTNHGDVVILDQRMTTKAYGRLLKGYIAEITKGSENGLQKGSAWSGDSAQPTLF